VPPDVAEKLPPAEFEERVTDAAVVRVQLPPLLAATVI
jgi:hypothetical protein